MPTSTFDIQDVLAIARRAGAEIMALRPSVIANPEIKGDGSPVTLADKRSSAIVIEGLEAIRFLQIRSALERMMSGKLGKTTP